MGLSEEHIKRLRTHSIGLVKDILGGPARVLEIGGGNGYQASVMASWGHRVESIDIRDSGKYHPVAVYDGINIPYPESFFDIVFSTSTLEHVPVTNLPKLLRESRRVLKPGGRAIHLVPTPLWRLWSMAAHYPFLIKWLLSVNERGGASITGSRAVNARSRAGLIRLALWSTAHGEYPSALSEIYYYRRRRWAQLFTDAGFVVAAVSGNDFFNTDYGVLPGMSPSMRRSLSKVLGSASHIFQLRPCLTSAPSLRTATPIEPSQLSHVT